MREGFRELARDPEQDIVSERFSLKAAGRAYLDVVDHGVIAQIAFRAISSCRIRVRSDGQKVAVPVICNRDAGY